MQSQSVEDEKIREAAREMFDKAEERQRWQEAAAEECVRAQIGGFIFGAISGGLGVWIAMRAIGGWA